MTIRPETPSLEDVYNRFRQINGSPGGIVAKRGTMVMVLFFLAALIAFSQAIYVYTQSRGVYWHGIVFGVVAVCFGVYFKTVKRPA